MINHENFTEDLRRDVLEISQCKDIFEARPKLTHLEQDVIRAIYNMRASFKEKEMQLEMDINVLNMRIKRLENEFGVC